MNTLDRLLVTLAAACLALSAPGVAAVRDVVNFGATPNDATDDAAAIQKAIDAAAEGDTVSLPSGTFLVNRTLRAKSGVRIQGAAADLTILKFNGVTHADFFNLSGTQKVELSGFTLEGNHNPNAHHGIFGHGGGGHWIHHLFQEQVPGHAAGKSGSDLSECRRPGLSVQRQLSAGDPRQQ